MGINSEEMGINSEEMGINSNFLRKKCTNKNKKKI